MDHTEDDRKNGEEQDVGRLINTISHQLKRQICSAEEDDSLTNMQRHILHYILFQSLQKEIYQKDVEQEFQIRRSTATGTLQLLERNGFIVRETVERDARLKRIRPTAKAEGVRERILENIQYMEHLLMREIDPKKLKICREVLEQMSLNLSQNEKTAEDLSGN